MQPRKWTRNAQNHKDGSGVVHIRAVYDTGWAERLCRLDTYSVRGQWRLTDEGVTCLVCLSRSGESAS